MSLMNGLELVKNNKLRSIPSFDIGGGNIDFIRASFEAAELVNSPVFLSSTPSTIKGYLGYKKYVHIIKMIAKDYKSNYAIHLDHAQKVEDVLEALNSGFTSVMYDGSHSSFEENVRNTLIVKSHANHYNASVEAEIGIIGGKEDEIEANNSSIPNINDILEFLQKTQVDFLAPAVGTVHGYFTGDPNIDYKLIRKLPFAKYNFVLHGCTGLEDKILNKLSKYGFTKFNFATTLRKIYRNSLLASLNDNIEHVKPSKILNPAKDALVTHMVNIINILNK